ncbi:MAG: 2-hydroxyacyl-CoA dehydratase [Desulfobacteraceae bacterium]|nr:2-hydroxyacyl-CoA dehydratase [Desulfobacteraceae bacterium]
MMYEHFDNAVKGISKTLEQDPEGIHARKKYVLGLSKLGKKLYTKDENIAWCGVTAPFDLLSAMGVTSCFVEFVGAMLAATQTAGFFFEEAEDSGFATDSCAYHRAVMGAVLKNAMPEPDFIIGTSSPCTAGLAIVENFAKQYKKDFFILNIPQNYTKDTINYLAAQIEEMTHFVSDHTQRPLSKKKLSLALENFNTCSGIIKDIYELAKTKPSPVDNKILKDFGTVVALLMGTQEGIDICQAFKDELSHRIATSQHLASKEHIRLMWIQNRIQYPFPINEMLDDLGAKVVVDELNNVTWELMDPDNPFESIAKRMISIPFSMNTSERIKTMKNLATDYQIDGAINPCHWGCRQGTGARGLISKGFKDINVPVLNLEIDCVDSRNLAKGQIETRVEAFIEMLS